MVSLNCRLLEIPYLKWLNDMRTRAIIIKKQNTNEYDQLVTCYTQELGKLTAVAKSVLKPRSAQAMQLDTLNLVSFELVSGRGMPIIAAAQAERSFAGIKESLPKLAAMHFFLEVLDRMAYDGQRDDALWDFLTGLLNDADTVPQAGLLPLFRARQLELLHILGYSPEAGQCVLCGSGEVRAGWALSAESGGLLCRQCFLSGRRGVLLRRDDLAFLTSGPFSPAAAAAPFRSVIDAVFEHLAGFRFNSLAFLYGLPDGIFSTGMRRATI